MEEVIIAIKKRADDMINSMDLQGESILAMENRTVVVNIEIDSPAILIGRGGEGLESLQHILRLLTAEELLNNDLDLVVDVAGYRKKKISQLTRTAKEKAYQVLATGISETMPPMSAYERRVVHMVCANIADVESESQGAGRERRVVIKPKRG